MAQQRSQSQGFLSTELETLTHVLRLVEAFRAFDGNNDGLINKAELGGIMGSLGYKPSEQEMKTMMQNGDKNNDGMLSIEEFLDLNTKDLMLGDQTTSTGRAILGVCDFEDEENVTGDEFCEVLENMGIQFSIGDCQNLIASLDSDGDGAISVDDIRLVFNSLL